MRCYSRLLALNTYSQVSVWQILASCNVCLFLPLHLSVGTNSHVSTRILIGTKRRQKQGSTEGLYNQQQWGKGNRKAPVSSCLSAALYLGPTDHTWPQPSSSFLDPKEEEWTRAFLVPLGSDLLCNFLFYKTEFLPVLSNERAWFCQFFLTRKILRERLQRRLERSWSDSLSQARQKASQGQFHGDSWELAVS